MSKRPICHCPPGTWPGSREVYARQVIYDTPAHIDSTRDKVAIDDCIASVVGELWRHGIVTRASCCGHGRQSPSIVIELESGPWELRTIGDEG